MFVPIMLALLATEHVTGTFTRFTNLQCEVLDPTYCAYTKCELKVLDRGIIGINIQALLLTGPFNNAKVHLSIWRKYNGYRPFMVNTTIDFCKFMSQKSTKLSFAKIFFDSIATNTNVNHSCPYDHDIIAHNLVFKEEWTTYFPVPSGEYKIQFTAASDNKWRTRISIYFIRKEDLLKS